MSIGATATKSALWQIGGSLSQLVVRVGASMILARHLLPEEFGLFATAYIVYAIVEMMSANGLTAGIIAKEKPSDQDISTCFILVAGIRLALFIMVYSAAGLIASLMGRSELAELIRKVAILILIMAVGTVPQGLMIKQMKFKELATIKVVGALLESVMAVLLVLLTDIRYWALVYSMLIGIGFINLAMFLKSGCRPSLNFSVHSLKYLSKYGYNGIGASITSYLAHNLDYLIVAKLLGPKTLGYYEFAYRIPHMVNERVSGPIGGVVFPALSSLRSVDNKRVLEGYLNATKYVSWICLPMLGGLAVTAPFVVHFLWGDKWLAIVTPMRILCISAALNAILDYSRSVFLCMERPDLEFKFQILNLVAAGCCVTVFGYKFGLNGIAFGMVMARTSSILQARYALKLLKSSLTKLLMVIIKPITSTGFMMALLWLFQLFLSQYSINRHLTLLFGLGMGVFLYTFIARTLFPESWDDIMTLVRRHLNIKSEKAAPVKL